MDPTLAKCLACFAVLSIATAGLAQSSPAGERPSTAPPPEQTPQDTDPPLAAAPPVESLVRIALDHSPSIAALRARFASSREQVAPAGALPDPMLGAMYQSAGPPWSPMAPMSMAQLELSQSLPGFGKRSARRKAAEADAWMRQSDIALLRARLGAEVRSTYARLYALDRERMALDAAEQLVQVLATGVAARYVAGQVDQEAVIKAELERSAIAERLSDLEADRAALVAQMNRLTARADSAIVGNVESLPEPTLDVAQTRHAAAEHAPELQLQHKAEHAAMRRVESAEVETRPNFVLGVAAGAMTTGDPIITLRFGFELPLWRSSKQDPLIRAARRDAEAVRQEHADVRLRVGEEVATLIARWNRDNDQLRRYREIIIPQTTMALDAARAGYTTGRADFTTVIIDFRAWLEAQVGLSRREADRFTTWAELYALTGGDTDER